MHLLNSKKNKTPQQHTSNVTPSVLDWFEQDHNGLDFVQGCRESANVWANENKQLATVVTI